MKGSPDWRTEPTDTFASDCTMLSWSARSSTRDRRNLALFRRSASVAELLLVFRQLLRTRRPTSFEQIAVALGLKRFLVTRGALQLLIGAFFRALHFGAGVGRRERVKSAAQLARFQFLTDSPAHSKGGGGGGGGGGALLHALCNPRCQTRLLRWQN